MSELDEIARYHLSELEVARSPSDPRRNVPVVPPGTQRILDIGCGAGQTLIAMDRRGAAAVGIDYDFSALQLGKQWDHTLQLLQATGEVLPFPDQSFDFVASRVALPYMKIAVAVRETARVLRPAGRLWFTLHPLSMLDWKQSVKSPRALAFQVYLLANTLALHAGAQQFRYPLKTSRTESYQTERGMRKCLEKAGFDRIEFQRNQHFTVTAVKR